MTNQIDPLLNCWMRVRKHRAPKGTLRLHEVLVLVEVEIKVRKNRAPKGALRLQLHDTVSILLDNKSESTERQTVH